MEKEGKKSFSSADTMDDRLKRNPRRSPEQLGKNNLLNMSFGRNDLQRELHRSLIDFDPHAYALN